MFYKNESKHDTSVSIRISSDLLEQARALDLNLSAFLRYHLEIFLKEKQALPQGKQKKSKKS